MTKNKRKILMACTQPYWSCLQLGSQHLARQFAAHGYRVDYLAAPITPLHLIRLKAPEMYRRFQNALQGPWAASINGIYSHIPLALLAPGGMTFFREPLVTTNWHKTILPPLQLFLKHNQLNHNDILYIDNISYHFLLDHVSYRHCIFRVMDCHDAFPGWQGRTVGMARKIASEADLTIYSAQHLKPYVNSLRPRKTLLVPNGVDFAHFQNPRADFLPVWLRTIPEPMVLFSGSLDIRLNLPLIQAAAQQLPDVSFVLAGPLAPNLKWPRWPSNVYCCGPVPHEILPSLMRVARAGLIPFDVKNQKRLIQGMRPLKLLEYMAAGLPVISARWPEVEQMNSPAWLYNSPAEFIRLLQEAVTANYDPNHSRHWARQHDWRRMFSLMSQQIGTDERESV